MEGRRIPIITKILEQKRRANRRSVHIDGCFAFGCNLNVVAKFKLREGMMLSEEQVEAIKRGEIRQECFDVAMDYLTRRLHSKAELTRKLLRKEYLSDMIGDVLGDLERMGYVDDARFAKTKAISAAQHKHHGKRRAQIELMKAGVDRTTANKALDDVYDATDSLALARDLARRKAPSLKRFEPLVAKRRMVGMLLRRGFDYDTIKPIIDEVLGHSQEED